MKCAGVSRCYHLVLFVVKCTVFCEIAFGALTSHFNPTPTCFFFSVFLTSAASYIKGTSASRSQNSQRWTEQQAAVDRFTENTSKITNQF